MATNQPTATTTAIFSEWYGDREFKAMLAKADWTPSRITSNFRSSVGDHEVTGTNWPSGGVDVTFSVTEAPNTFQTVITLEAFTVADVTTTDPARYLVVYEDTGNAATDRICRWYDIRTPIIYTNDPVIFDASDAVISHGVDR